MLNEFNELASAMGCTVESASPQFLQKTGFNESLKLIRIEDNQELEISVDDQQYLVSSGEYYSKLFSLEDKAKVLEFTEGFCISGLQKHKRTVLGFIKKDVFGVINKDGKLIY